VRISAASRRGAAPDRRWPNGFAPIQTRPHAQQRSAAVVEGARGATDGVSLAEHLGQGACT
jgi:hypothetical protein